MPTEEIPILLIDDQPIVAVAVRRLLADAPDLILHHCADPEKAEIEAEHAQLILLDLVLGKTDGLEVLRRIRANPRLENLPIMILSVTEDPHTKAKAFTVGADDYVIKLPDTEELVARIRALLRRSQRR
ncbi:MAG: response regulator [Gemmataceae bacterium]